MPLIPQLPGTMFPLLALLPEPSRISKRATMTVRRSNQLAMPAHVAESHTCRIKRLYCLRLSYN